MQRPRAAAERFEANRANLRSSTSRSSSPERPRHRTRTGRPEWAGPFDDALPRALRPRSRRRPVDQPEPARSVSWLDSAGFPASGRGLAAPAREGRLSSQSPRGSRAVSARTTPFLPYTHGAAEPAGRQPQTRGATPARGGRLTEGWTSASVIRSRSAAAAAPASSFVDHGDLDRADLGVDPREVPGIDRVPDPVAVVVERERVGADPVGVARRLVHQQLRGPQVHARQVDLGLRAGTAAGGRSSNERPGSPRRGPRPSAGTGRPGRAPRAPRSIRGSISLGTSPAR